MPASLLLPQKFMWSETLTFILSLPSFLGKILDLEWGVRHAVAQQAPQMLTRGSGGNPPGLERGAC